MEWDLRPCWQMKIIFLVCVKNDQPSCVRSASRMMSTTSFITSSRQNIAAMWGR